MIETKNIKPEAVKVQPAGASSTWNYKTSVEKVKGLYLSWKSITEEMLEELWLSKQAILKGGSRKAGMPKAGEKSWSAYVKECFGERLSKRTIDSHIKRYFENGMSKPEKLTVKTISDHSKLILHSVERVGDRIKLDIYLPEHNEHYIQYIAA